MQGYLSFRGHNKAFAAEEFSKVVLITIVALGLVSSLNLMGLMVLPNRLAFLRRLIPKRFRKPIAAPKN